MIKIIHEFPVAYWGCYLFGNKLYIPPTLKRRYTLNFKKRLVQAMHLDHYTPKLWKSIVLWNSKVTSFIEPTTSLVIWRQLVHKKTYRNSSLICFLFSYVWVLELPSFVCMTAFSICLCMRIFIYIHTSHTYTVRYHRIYDFSVADCIALRALGYMQFWSYAIVNVFVLVCM